MNPMNIQPKLLSPLFRPGTSEMNSVETGISDGRRLLGFPKRLAERVNLPRRPCKLTGKKMDVLSSRGSQ